MFFHFSLFRTPPLAPGFEVRNPTLSHLTGMWNSHADIVHISTFINASPVCADKDEKRLTRTCRRSRCHARRMIPLHIPHYDVHLPLEVRARPATEGAADGRRGFPGSEDAARRPPPRSFVRWRKRNEYLYISANPPEGMEGGRGRGK